MTKAKAEAINLLNESAIALVAVADALTTNNSETTKERFAEALRLLDNTCAIQLDNLN